jgi:RNA polymerase sigma factor (sigma-70 family)
MLTQLGGAGGQGNRVGTWGDIIVAESETTAAVQRYLSQLAGVQGDSPVEPVVSALLARSAHRLHQVCASLLYRSYPRLTRPPYSVQAEEVLSGVVERLLKALREARPQTVRQFFAMSNQHIRWEMNDLARRLDEHVPMIVIDERALPSAESSGSQLNPTARRILEAIEGLPENEREVFSLVRIQGMTHAEVADTLSISTKTVQRRLNLGLVLLTERLGDLSPAAASVDEN